MQSFGHSLVILPCINSTNNYAMARVHARLTTHGTIYFALDQTEGKGQRGKQWKSEPGLNIMMSLVLEPHELRPSQTFLLNAAVSLACLDFFASYAGEPTSIKWPNDIYWDDRKAGGILIENLIHGPEWLYAVVGIGININQIHFPDPVPNAISLKQITGKDYDLNVLVAELTAFLEKRYSQLITNAGEAILEEYRSRLFRLNEPVRLKKDNIVFEAFVRSVSSQGKLIVERGFEQEFDFGEVEWLGLR